jgi:hypothetical protein
MVRGAGCREPNPRIPHREKNVLDMPSYRSGDYTHYLDCWRFANGLKLTQIRL